MVAADNERSKRPTAGKLGRVDSDPLLYDSADGPTGTTPDNHKEMTAVVTYLLGC